MQQDLHMAQFPSNIRALDRVLVLKVMEGKEPINTIGSADKRLFTGDNKLHAEFDEQAGLWDLRYEKGIIPPPLNQRFTSFSILMTHVSDYYKRRNIEVVEIKD